MSAITLSGTEQPIPFLDLASQHRMLETELVAAFRTALQSAAFVNGPVIEAFENEFAAYCNVKSCVGVSSGTDSLRFAYLALGVKPGDEIITVSNTFIATTESITQAGGTVKFVDVDPGTMCIDPSAIRAAITDRTVGIVPVHLYGQMADMDPILEIARKHDLWVVEDAAQAHGATYKGRTAGSIGAMGSFSFYPGKNLGACGEGGAVTGNDLETLATVRRLREHGQSKKYFHDTEGYNGRLDAIQAAFLRIKLRHLPAWNEGRRRVAAQYREALADLPEVQLPHEAEYGEPAYHLFVIRVDRRDELQAYLTSHGIHTGLHYPLPLHLQAAYANRGYRSGMLPVTERAATRLLSLPMFPELTSAQVERVADAIRMFVRD